MALTWNWSDKIGEMYVYRHESKEPTHYNLYKCNGLVVALYEWEENHETYYNMGWFFTDMAHCKRCLKDNIFYDAFMIQFDLHRSQLNNDLYRMILEFLKTDSFTVEVEVV